jgi:hypothetical protein
MRRALIPLAAAGIAVAALMAAPAAANAQPDARSGSSTTSVAAPQAGKALSCTKNRASTTGSVTCTSGRYYVQLTCHLYGPPPQMTIVNGPIVNAPSRSSASCPAWYVLTSDSDVRAVSI